MKNYIIDIKWGVYFVIMQLAWMSLEKLLGFHSTNIENHQYFTNLVMIPAIAIYVFALIDKKKKFYNGNMNYMQGLITGLIISLVVTMISPITQYLVSMVISPDYFKNMIEYSVSQNLMTQQEAESYFSLNNYLMQTVIFTPVMGIITSAIVSFFVKTKIKSDSI